MTCIVALVENGIAYVAGDSLAVNVPNDFHNGGVSQTVRHEPKVFRKGPMLFGFNGSVRMGQLLRYEFEVPEYPEGMDKIKYLVSRFIPSLQGCLKSADFDREGLGGNILMVWEGKIFTIGNAWHVCDTTDGYESIGKASEVAIGSLHTTAQLGLPPHERLVLALQAAQHHTCVVSVPFTFISSEMEQAELLDVRERNAG